ncbi:hypothetical protein [uncultured Roseovarius sp.]|nr:hypothetical protein [uncultured Roseovarius sp.]
MFFRFAAFMKRTFPRLNLNYLGDPIASFRQRQKLFFDEPE